MKLSAFLTGFASGLFGKKGIPMQKAAKVTIQNHGCEVSYQHFDTSLFLPQVAQALGLPAKLIDLAGCFVFTQDKLDVARFAIRVRLRGQTFIAFGDSVTDTAKALRESIDNLLADKLTEELKPWDQNNPI